MFQMSKQWNQGNLLSPSEIEETRISQCSDRQNQLHKSNTKQGLQTVGLWSPVKGGQPRSPTKGDFPVWRCEQITRESENWSVSSKRTFFETITHDASNPFSKVINKIPQDNQLERGILNQFGNISDKFYSNFLQDRLF